MEFARSRPEWCLTDDCSCLPSPLKAAAACGQVETVQWITNNLSGEAETAAFHLKFHPGVEAAFISAMRKGQKKTAHLLFDAIDQGRIERGGEWARRLWYRCVKYQDMGILRRIPVLMVKKWLAQEHHYPFGHMSSPMEILLREGSCSVLRALLEDKMFGPNEWDVVTPLTLAILNHRYDLARVLLQYGAHIDAVPSFGKQVTTLWHAAKEGFVGGGSERLPGICFLLKHGANPDIYGDWRSPLRAAEKGWPDVYFLLRQAKEFGVDVALRPETWEKYEKTKSGLVELVDLTEVVLCRRYMERKGV